MQNKKIFLAIMILLVAIPCSAFGLDARRDELKGGLVVLHAERHNLPIVMVTLLVKASPLDEPPDKAGLANLAASMLTEGTEKRSSKQISSEIEFIGGSIHASADDDYTTVSLSVLKKDVRKGFDIFSDVVLNPIFPEEELLHKKELIKGALRQSEDDPEYVAEKAFKKAVYSDHPYGRPVSGTPEGIDSITRGDLVEFHSRYYLPNNSILSVAGDLTHDELRDLVNAFLSSWEQGKLPEQKKQDVQGVESTKVITIDRDLTQANIVLGHLGIRRSNPDFYAISVMNYILGGGGFSSRLMEIVRDQQGLAYSIYSAFIPSVQKGVFEAAVQTKNESANTVVREILEQMERIRENQVTDQELSDAIAYLTGSFPRRLDTLSKLSTFMAVVEFYNLGLDYDKKYMGYIKDVSAKDVLRVAQEYLHPDKYVLVVVANQKKAGIDRQSK